MLIVTQKARKLTQKKRVNESILAFKKELKAITFEPFYGSTIKDIIAKLTVKLEEITSEYGYEIEFPEKAKTEIEGDIYYFEYDVKIKTKVSNKKITIQVQFMNVTYEQGGWMGIITSVK